MAVLLASDPLKYPMELKFGMKKDELGSTYGTLFLHIPSSSQ